MTEARRSAPPPAPPPDRALLRKAAAVVFVAATAWPLFASRSPTTTWFVVHGAWLFAIVTLAIADRAPPAPAEDAAEDAS